MVSSGRVLALWMMVLLCAGLGGALAWAQQETVRRVIDVDAVTTSEAFAEDVRGAQDDPQRVTALFVVALLAYLDDPRRGEACLAQVVGDSLREDGALAPELRSLLAERLAGSPEMAYSLIAGATPRSGYRLPEPPYQIVVSSTTAAEQDRIQVWVYSSGADAKRPVTLQRTPEEGWRIMECSALFSNVHPAPA